MSLSRSVLASLGFTVALLVSPTQSLLAQQPPAAQAGNRGSITGVVTQGTTRAQVVLTGLKSDLQVGPTYPVVLTFERAGSVTLQVPVANPSENQGRSGE